MGGIGRHYIEDDRAVFESADGALHRILKTLCSKRLLKFVEAKP